MPSRIAAFLLLTTALCAQPTTKPAESAIFLVGDGMGVSTVTAARIFSVGVAGKLVLDQAPHVALSRTFTSDFITADSAGTMSAMVTGVKTNSGIFGFGAKAERGDFNSDGNGKPLTTILELAKASGKSVGLVTTARITHATPAACYAKSNERNDEDPIILQALPGDPQYNPALLGGIDLLFGGGRRHFVPRGQLDEEGARGRRSDGRDLRAEFQKAGYTYVWNSKQFSALNGDSTPVLGLFEASHMEWEFDRRNDVGGEPSLQAMTEKAIEILSRNPKGYFLMVESGRIDHAHHAGNAWRALVDTEEFDQTVGAVVKSVDLSKTLIIATADHSHVFNIQGYPLRPLHELPYKPLGVPEGYSSIKTGSGLFDKTYGLSGGKVVEARDSNGVAYTPLIYGNGPGYRGSKRVDPTKDDFKGMSNKPVKGPNDPNYRQESALPLGSETHAGEDVAMYAFGSHAHLVSGTQENTHIFHVLRQALGL